MFSKLRLKLTLINTMVIGFVLLFIFSGIYFVTWQGLVMQSERLMNSMISEEHSKAPPPYFRPQKRLGSNYFYVESDIKGSIINSSPDMLMTSEGLPLLLKETLAIRSNKGQVKLNNETYRFVKASTDFDNNLIKIVFFSTEAEREMLSGLMTTLLAIGIFALIMSFTGSLFMADRALIPIKEAWEKQRAFVADASHELRTPLAVIRTNLELVLGNPNDTIESQSKWLSYIQDESNRMNSLVDNLLFLARADSNEDNINKTDFELDSLLISIVDSFKPIALSKNINMDLNVDSGTVFNGDENRMKQLITILIDNAIKYNHPGGQIFVSMKSQENAVEISVSDTGEGIPKEHISKVFERFYRVDTSRSRESGGTGLGLSIAGCIAKEFGGNISVNSAPGEGSTFRVIFPIAK